MKYIGIKQVLKNVKEDKVKKVYIAKDAEQHVISELIDVCKEKSISITYVNTMSELGKKAGIEVGASCMAE